MKHSFRRQAFLGVLLATSSLFAATANAETVFTVQLGSYKTQEEAKDHWDKVLKQFPDIFDPLTYAPTQVQLPPENAVYTRAMAGPIDTKEHADAICERLQVKGFECYVAETAMFTADGKSEDIASAPAPEETKPAPVIQPLPSATEEEDVRMMGDDELESIYSPAAPVQQQTQAQPVAPEPQPQATAQPAPSPVTPTQTMAAAAPSAPARPMPWQQIAAPGNAPFSVGQSPYAGAPGAAPSQPVSQMTAPVANITPSASQQAQVKVAEAIPVPLSVATEPYRSPNSNLSYRHYPSETFSTNSLWAEIRSFKSQEDALGYWGVLSRRDTAMPQGLRLRVVKPLRSRYSDKVSLRVGPFAGPAAVRRLCALTHTEGLYCRAVKDLGTSVSANTMRERYNPANRWQNGASGAQGGYWLQLGAFPAPNLALAKWEELKALHTKTLKGVHEQIASPRLSSSARPVYRLQAGPYTTSSDAASACGMLMQQGTMCLVVQGR